jgi:N-glycosylase/DNA lyase
MSAAVTVDLPTPTEEPWWAGVWARHGSSYEVATPPRSAGETALRKELVFCVLGGHGVTFELASSATKVVTALRPFDPAWTIGRLRGTIRRELSKPQFEPRRRDGSLRRYRYPTRKAHLIADAVAWVNAEGGLRRGLAAHGTESARRAWLCECPGVGMKTASWLLRNSGWAKNLAILDVHVMRAMAEADIIQGAVLPGDYEAVEMAYLSWADRLGACPAALDLFLWDVERNH